MMHLVAALFAIALFAAPLLVLAVDAVAVAGSVGLLLAAGGIALGRRALVSAAAFVFLADYASALWAAGGPVNAAGAAGVGLAAALLLDAADLARRMPGGASDEISILRAQLGRWALLAGASFVIAVLATLIAGPVAAALPPAGAPLLAAAGALGTALIAALVIGRGAIRLRSASRGTPQGD